MNYLSKDLMSLVLEKLKEYEQWILACTTRSIRILVRKNIRKLIIKRHLLNRAFRSACGNGHKELIEWLLMKKYGPRDFNGGLLFACRSKQLEIVELLIAKGVDDWNSGLRGACQGGHLELAKLMIQKGAKISSNAVGCACYHGHIEIVELLIKKSFKHSHLRTGFTSACKGRHKKIAKLISNKDVIDPDLQLSIAIKFGYFEIVKWLFKYNIFDHYSTGPALYYACQGGHREISEFLIAQGYVEGHAYICKCFTNFRT